MRLNPLALGALFCASAGAAFAQNMPTQMTNTASKRTTEVRFDVVGLYDSNIAHSSSAEATRRGLELHDYTLRPNLHLNIIQPIGRQTLFIAGDGGYDFHKNNSQLDSQRVDVAAGGIAPVGPCRAVAQAGYRAAQSELDELQGSRVKNLQTTQRAMAGLQCARNIGFSLSATANRDKITNSYFAQKQTNATTESASVAIGYRSPSLGDVSVVSTYADTDFPLQPVLSPTNLITIGNSLLIRTIGVSYEKRIGSKLDVKGLVSETFLKRDKISPGSPQKSNFNTYRGEVTYRLSTRITLGAISERAIVPSNRIGKLYDVNTNSEINVRYGLGANIELTGGGRVEDVKSNSTSSLVGDLLNKSRTETAYISVRYRQSRRLSWLVDLRQEERKTNLPAFNYSATQASLTTSISF